MMQQTTEFERLKHEYELILSAAGEGIYGLDIEGRARFANAASERILGWKMADIQGKKLHDLHHHSYPDGSHYPETCCPIYAAIKDGEVYRVDNEVFWHRDGSAVPVEYISTPIIQDGEIRGAVIVFRDIRERLALAQQRQKDFDEIKRLTQALAQERDLLREEINVTQSFGEIIGESPALKRTLAQIEAVAATPTSVLILGESGVGKEMIARAIHERSDRRDGPLVKVNCASIPKDLFESEFFGHVKGAFTGAQRDRVGRLQLADRGTLFLDEVGEIPLALQGKLLRALQEQEFEPVGDERTLRVDVRIVAATNRDLLHAVKKGEFREDLYYRLSVFPVAVPPLRERVQDIAPLTQYFVTLISQSLGRDRLQLSQQHMQRLQTHTWPGNIRELRNVIERAVILSRGVRLRLDLALPELFPLEIPTQDSIPTAPITDATSTQLNQQPSAEFLTEAEFRALEKENLLRALQAHQWKIAGPNGVAQAMGLKPSTVAFRMQKFAITRP